jgi:glycosyltransferase involved in cell wall biosynthesis
MGQNIKISICIPTYNRAGLLDQTLTSVASQTVKPFEVLVIDNHSSDSTPEVAGRYQKFGFRFVRNLVNAGITGNYNRCISLFTGTHLSILGSDDLIAPDWYEEWLRTITRIKADLYTSAFAVIEGQQNIRITHHPFSQNKLIRPGKVPVTIMPKLFPLVCPGGATVYSRKIFELFGKFDEKMGTESDAEFFLRIQDKVSVYYLNRILFGHRFHKEQTYEKEKRGKTFTDRLQRMKNYFLIIKSAEKKYQSNRWLWKKILLTHVLMTLASANLFIVKGEIGNITTANRIALKMFPDLLENIFDWMTYLKIQLIMIYRACLGTFIARRDRAETAWLKPFMKPHPRKKALPDIHDY